MLEQGNWLEEPRLFTPMTNVNVCNIVSLDVCPDC